MNDPSPERQRRRWITFGEIIALAALAISGLGLWNGWQKGDKAGPTEVVEKAQAVPLVLRGAIVDGGKSLRIAPVESSHALEQLVLRFPGSRSIDLGSDGVLSARDLERVLGDAAERKGAGQIAARAEARYVERGQFRRSTRTYMVHYLVEGGGLFGGKSLRLTGFGGD